MNFLTASVDIKVDDSKLPSQLAKVKTAVTRTVNKIKTSFSKMATSFKSAFTKMARYAKWMLVIFTGIGIASVKMAADVEDSEDFFTMAMGRMAESTRKWSEELAKSLYLNASSVRGFVAIFNEMLTAMGLGTKEAANMSQQMTELAYDLVSYHPKVKNITEASIVLQGALTGEREMLKRLGYYYSENTVKLKSMAMGFGDNLRLLTASQKAQVNYVILLERMKNVQGDLNRTNKNAANVFRSIGGLIKDIAEDIGAILLPAVNKAALAMRNWMSESKELIAIKFVETIQAIVQATEVFVNQVRQLNLYWTSAVIRVKQIQLIMNQISQISPMRGLGDLSAWMRGDKRTFANEIKRLKAEIGMLEIKAEELAESFVEGTPKIDAFFDSIIKGLEKTKEGIKAEKSAVKSIVEQYADALRAKMVMIDEELAANQKRIDDYQRTEDAILELRSMGRKKMIADLIERGKDAKKITQEQARIYNDIALGMARSFSDAFDAMIFEGQRFAKTMTDMLRGILRMIVEILTYEMIARPLAVGIMEGLGYVPSAQHGGTVEKTGLAVIHKGETFSGVGGGGGKPMRFDFHIHNEGGQQMDISNVQTEPDTEGYVINIMIKDSLNNGRFSQLQESRFRKS